MYRLTELRRLAEAYIGAKKITARALSVEICGLSNNVIIQRLLSGHGVTGPNIEVLSDHFDKHWPEDLAWPKGIARNGATRDSAPE